MEDGLDETGEKEGVGRLMSPKPETPASPASSPQPALHAQHPPREHSACWGREARGWGLQGGDKVSMPERSRDQGTHPRPGSQWVCQAPLPSRPAGMELAGRPTSTLTTQLDRSELGRKEHGQEKPPHGLSEESQRHISGTFPGKQ